MQNRGFYKFSCTVFIKAVEQLQPSILEVPEIRKVDIQSEKKEPENRERLRSGSWGGANESEDEIKVRVIASIQEYKVIYI